MQSTEIVKHRHIIERERYEAILQNPESSEEDKKNAALRLKVLDGIFNLALEVRKDSLLCYEDACSLELAKKGCVICGKPGKLFSGRLRQVFCESDVCYEMAQRGSEPQNAKIIRTKKEGLQFVQGDLRFPVYSDLDKTLGAAMYGGQGSVLDRLMDSQIITLATANGIPVNPFVRELVLSPLRGLVQLVWYRDLEKQCDMDRLQANQIARIADYQRNLAQYKPTNGETSKRISKKSSTLTQSFRVTKTQPAKGRARQLWDVIAVFGEKGASGAQIREKAEGAVKTKQDLDKIVARFIGELLEAKAIEPV